jgi:hypothetical protein
MASLPFRRHHATGTQLIADDFLNILARALGKHEAAGAAYDAIVQVTRALLLLFDVDRFPND